LIHSQSPPRKAPASRSNGSVNKLPGNQSKRVHQEQSSEDSQSHKKFCLDENRSPAHCTQADESPLRSSSATPMERLSIRCEHPKPLIPGRLTIFNLPGELRDLIFSYTFGQMSCYIPLDPFYRNHRSPYTEILLSLHEARSYIKKTQVVYVPVMMGMNWSYGEPTNEYPYQRATKDTMALALTENTNTHFHLHVDVLRTSDYNLDALLASLTQAIEVFCAHSWNGICTSNTSSVNAVPSSTSITCYPYGQSPARQRSTSPLNTLRAFGDELQCVSRHRRPGTELWPNVHFDPAAHHAANRKEYISRQIPSRANHKRAMRFLKNQEKKYGVRREKTPEDQEEDRLCPGKMLLG
ncbi:hypothetical protein IAQ61_011174, partial [Plenodomus lingam]|uniref:uncharacterized protein n=1 Tax=Leptosphaeria maculans TaxID=5022 RepID=UPI00331C20C2